MAMHALALDADRNDEPRQDSIVVLPNATWADYQRMLEMRGEGSTPRLHYLEGRLEIMSPTATHGELKSVIGRLVEVFCLERGIEFRALGSWTLEDEAAERGAEPDECYVFGDRRPPRPDLVIEVVWTSGGLEKLDIYRKLGVREVWFWRKGRIGIHVLRGEKYEESETSEALPDIDVSELASFLDRPTTSAAIRDYREALRQR
jgi:Uma2 family endonuclease